MIDQTNNEVGFSHQQNSIIGERWRYPHETFSDNSSQQTSSEITMNVRVLAQFNWLGVSFSLSPKNKMMILFEF
jgi:exopolyphosphatase/pppGpp-phosphohydrolase